MASAIYDTVNTDLVCEGHLFKASGYSVKFKGFTALYEESPDDPDNEKNVKLPEIKKGAELDAKDVISEQHFTEPPARYTEASLIKFLEEKGIGRPSTFATIITTITSRDYVKREGKTLRPTELGELTTKLMIEAFPDIVDYKFTASMEDKLDSIENGQLSMSDTLSEFYDAFKIELENAEKNISKNEIEIPVEETDLICEKCGSKMIVKNGKFGKFAACPNYPKCKNTKQLKPVVEKKPAPAPELAPFKCELCGSDVVVRQGRYGSFYACTKYPECKFTRPKLRTIGVKCPLCGKEILLKHGRNKSVFYSCEGYPTCSFSSWDLPLNEKCPDCGSILYQKKGKKTVFCKNENCNYKYEKKDDNAE
jgi:DNA topoisomerase-1